MTDITKYNGERCILDQIELHIEDKDKIGILGVNGTGKSTLLKIISGIEDYQGKMTYQKDYVLIIYHKHLCIMKWIQLWKQFINKLIQKIFMILK